MLEQKTPLASAAVDGASGGQQGNQPLLLMDDPVLDGIKCHLAIGERIGFEPMNQRFARIAFFVKSRMEMKMSGYQHFHKHTHMDSMQLIVKTKNDRNKVPLDIALTDVKAALQSLFRRVRKWRSVDFAHFDAVIHENCQCPCFCDCECCCLPSIIERLIGDILGACLAESRPVIDIRRCACRHVHETDQENVSKLLHRSAPSLRQLTVGLGMRFGKGIVPPQPILVDAIGACTDLRQLVFGDCSDLDQFPSTFVPMLTGLTKLNGLRLGSLSWQSTIDPRTLSIDCDFLPLAGQLAFAPILKKMKSLRLVGYGSNALPLASVARIIAEMRPPADVLIGYGITWTNVWNDYLPLVYSTRAHVQFDTSFGLPQIMEVDFATGVSSLPAIMQSTLIPPDLANVTLVRLGNHYTYMQLEFSFPSGGKLTIKRKTRSIEQ